MLDRNLREGGIAEQHVAVVVALLANLGEQVEPVEVRERTDIKVGQHVEHHQRGQPLAGGRALVDVVAAIAGRDRHDHVGPRAGEIVEGVQAAELSEPVHHVFGHRPGVEALRAVFSDAPERGCELRQAQDAADRRHLSAGQVGFCGVRDRSATRSAPRCQSQPTRCWIDEPIRRVADRRLEQLAEGPGAVFAHHQLPGRDGARHRDGVRRGRGDRDAVLGVPVGRGGGGRPGPNRRGRWASWRPRGRRGRSSRRRCRSSADRPRIARPPPRCRHRRRCRRRAGLQSRRASRVGARSRRRRWRRRPGTGRGRRSLSRDVLSFQRRPTFPLPTRANGSKTRSHPWRVPKAVSQASKEPPQRGEGGRMSNPGRLI